MYISQTYRYDKLCAIILTTLTQMLAMNLTAIFVYYTFIFLPCIFHLPKKDAVSVDIARVDIARIDIAVRYCSRVVKNGTIVIQ